MRYLIPNSCTTVFTFMHKRWNTAGRWSPFMVHDLIISWSAYSAISSSVIRMASFEAVQFWQNGTSRFGLTKFPLIIMTREQLFLINREASPKHVGSSWKYKQASFILTLKRRSNYVGAFGNSINMNYILVWEIMEFTTTHYSQKLLTRPSTRTIPKSPFISWSEMSCAIISLIKVFSNLTAFTASKFSVVALNINKFHLWYSPLCSHFQITQYYLRRSSNHS